MVKGSLTVVMLWIANSLVQVCRASCSLSDKVGTSFVMIFLGRGSII
jgi:hypothetical protein